MTTLKIDHARVLAQDEIIRSGIVVRAQAPDGTFRAADIVELDGESLFAWLRQRGGHNPRAEDAIGILLGHGQLATLSALEEGNADYLKGGDAVVALSEIATAIDQVGKRLETEDLEGDAQGFLTEVSNNLAEIGVAVEAVRERVTASPPIGGPGAMTDGATLWSLSPRVLAALGAIGSFADGAFDEVAEDMPEEDREVLAHLLAGDAE